MPLYINKLHILKNHILKPSKNRHHLLSLQILHLNLYCVLLYTSMPQMQLIELNLYWTLEYSFKSILWEQLKIIIRYCIFL